MNNEKNASQILSISKRIENLTEHLKANKKDNSAKRGLHIIVCRRKRMLKYLKQIDVGMYKTMIDVIKHKNKHW